MSLYANCLNIVLPGRDIVFWPCALFSKDLFHCIVFPVCNNKIKLKTI